MKKGFTLVELLAVIVLICVIFVLAMPPILNSINSKKNKLDDASKLALTSAAKLYLSNNVEKFPRTKGNRYCISLSELVDNEILNTEIYNVKGELVGLNNFIEVNVSDNGFDYKYNQVCNQIIKPGVINRPEIKYPYNAPILDKKMIPIYYNEKSSNWIYANEDSEWHNYEKKQWANAVVLKNGITKKSGDVILESDIDLWYVWIPRYKYKLFDVNNKNQIIKVEFEKGTNNTGDFICKDLLNSEDLKIEGGKSEKCYKKTGNNIDKSSEYVPNNNDYYTHPAFTFGIKELEGIWVGKFEISDFGNANSSTNKIIERITIKPNVPSLRNQRIAIFYNGIKKMRSDYNMYGDTHMIKNMEWGAVAYFTQSQYGLGMTEIQPNLNSTYKTGGGNYKINVGQSSTGNIYGIYDLNAGAYEYIMANSANSNGLLFVRGEGIDGFENAETENIDNIYYNIYNYNNSSTNYKVGKLGDATKETIEWYGGNASFPSENYPWIKRGGDINSDVNSGIFDFKRVGGGNGAANTSRAIFVNY